MLILRLSSSRLFTILVFAVNTFQGRSITSRLAPNFVSVVIQILLLDIVFSLDSVITAVGMARDLGVMTAVRTTVE